VVSVTWRGVYAVIALVGLCDQSKKRTAWMQVLRLDVGEATRVAYGSVSSWVKGVVAGSFPPHTSLVSTFSSVLLSRSGT